MSKISMLAPLAMLLLSLTLFRAFQKQVSGLWFVLGTHPELRALLEQAGEDLKLLAELNPGEETGYRARFERIQRARRNIGVLLRSRDQLISRYELFLLTGLGTVVLIAVCGHFWDRRRTAVRLKRIKWALEEMARGHTRIRVGDHGKDVLGRIGGMIEETARVIAVQRRRLGYLANLSEWQDAARRVAHEIRTPLSTIRLLASRLSDEPRAGLLEEVKRLNRFAEGFSSFAGIGRPRKRAVALSGFLREFGDLFKNAWPGIALHVLPGAKTVVYLDRGMLRQVLINLCNNAAKAMVPDREGLIRIEARTEDGKITLRVRDNGSGIPEDFRERVFKPYATTRPPGEGQGLGLAISHKIMLEHGGDLELSETSSSGTTFLLWLPTPAHEQSGLEAAS